MLNFVFSALIMDWMGGVIFGMLGSLPVPAIIRKLQANHLIAFADNRSQQRTEDESQA